MTDFKSKRERLILKLSGEIKDERVLSVMSRLPRELFVPTEIQNIAYEDIPLSIGQGQTISQPYITALMTSALELTSSDKVLEIGTGSGYQTAILAELAREVISVERLPELAKAANKLLNKLGYKNIRIYNAGEHLGWRPEAPYDAIIVTAGAPDIPKELLSQLSCGGRMVIPAGSRDVQELYKITKQPEGNVIDKMGGCRFVALIGQDAWDNQVQRKDIRS